MKTAKITLNINGEERTVEVEPRDTLLDTLRDKLDLTGAKKGCNEGVCGACSVLLNGRIVSSCNMFAVEATGARITTIEGVAKNDLDPIQRAFVQFDALQCGFCTSGQILAAKSFLDSFDGEVDEEQIKEQLSGNICRCGCYNNIVKAIRFAALQVGGRRG